MTTKKAIYTIILMATFIGCSKFPDLGNGYKLDYNGNNDVYLLNASNTIVVNGHVSNYCFDYTFIIVDQKPRDIILRNAFNKPGMDLKKREKIFKESSIRQYWIINKVKDSVYGPYEKEVYMQKRKELGVPGNLRLKSE